MLVHVYRTDVAFDDLVRETRDVSAGWDWSRGAFGHALSLPASRELHPSRRYSYENSPCLGVLRRYPALSAVFDSFRCPKVSFRLLRRAPRTAYSWHTDLDKGPGVVRFQIPIFSDERAFLVVTDYTSPAQLRGGTGRHLSEESFAAFAAANAGHFTRARLECGLLHYFDTTRVHTLVNAGSAERITLAFDLRANDWLREAFPAIRGEIAGAAFETGAAVRPLHQALAFARSRLYPLRNRARAWRAQAGASRRGAGS